MEIMKVPMEGMKVFTAAGLVFGSAAVTAVAMADLTTLQILAVVGLFTGFQWMPYLMAIIMFNGTMSKMWLDGLYLKLAYAPLPAPLPKWVNRAIVAHNNSLENYTLFGIAVLLATAMGVPDGATTLPALVYFGGRVGHWVFTVAPPIFMIKTASWFMALLANMYIFYLCLPL